MEREKNETDFDITPIKMAVLETKSESDFDHREPSVVILDSAFKFELIKND